MEGSWTGWELLPPRSPLCQALADLKGKTEAIPCVIGGEEVWTPTVRYQLSVSQGFSLNGGEQSRGVPVGGSWDWFLQSLFFSSQPFNHAHKVAKFCYASKVSAPVCPPSSWLLFGEAAALGLGLASEMHFVSREAPGAFPSPRDPGANPPGAADLGFCRHRWSVPGVGDPSLFPVTWWWGGTWRGSSLLPFPLCLHRSSLTKPLTLPWQRGRSGS